MLTWGRVQYEKGFQVLARAMTPLRSRVPGHRVHRSPAAAATCPSCSRRSTSRASATSCTWSGFLPDDKLRDLLHRAGCVVIPSLYEPFGIVALEALAGGAPLIAARTGGLAELIDGTGAGLLFEPGQRRRAGRAASSMVLSDHALADEMRRRGDALLADRYSWDGDRRRARSASTAAPPPPRPRTPSPPPDRPRKLISTSRIVAWTARFRAAGISLGRVRRRPSVRERVRPKVTSLARLCDRYVDSRFTPPSRRRCRRCPSSPQPALGVGPGAGRAVRADLAGLERRQAHPAHMVRTTSSERLQALAADPAIVRDLAGAKGRLDAALNGPTWFGARADSPLRDGRLLLARVRHQRGAAAVLGRPRRARRRPPQGLVRPRRAARRRRPALHRGLLPPASSTPRAGSSEHHPEHRPRVARARRHRRRPSPSTSPATRTVARVWRADVGRIPLYLLDTDVEGNSPDGVAVTDRLYGGD